MLNGCGTFPLVKMRNKWRELRFGPSPGLWYTLMMQMLFDVFVWVQRLTNFYVCLVFFFCFFLMFGIIIWILFSKHLFQ